MKSARAKETPADALKAGLDAGAKVLVIDLRGEGDVGNGSVPGALHLPVEELEARMNDIPRDVQLVFT